MSGVQLFVGVLGEEHVVLAHVEPDPLQDSQAAGLQQQQPAGPQTMTHGQALRHADRLQTLQPTQSLVLHEHLTDQTQGKVKKTPDQEGLTPTAAFVCDQMKLHV
ncbi:hypothetical protein XENOCAPTIV_023907 [Xenoophorus captivus]|uniref:Uncharacterized protein n=1 Tax=Xenoophorus captivus TaxID=1517983 RepID=A0ABV0QJS7_9TELE